MTLNTGIAMNLRSDRLRDLEKNGVIERQLGDSGIDYALTPWGAELREPMEDLGRWGIPLLATGRGNDSFQPRWLTLALPAILKGATATPPLETGFKVEDLMIVLRVDESGPRAEIDSNSEPETVLAATAEMVVGLVSGNLSVEQALAGGRLLRGTAAVLYQIVALARHATPGSDS